MTNHLADPPSPLALPSNDYFPNYNVLTIDAKTWELYFDGCKCRTSSSAGVILIPHIGKPIPLSYWLNFLFTNNIVEYELLIVGLRATLIMGVKDIKIFADSQLVIKQINGTYRAKHKKLSKYKYLIMHLLEKFQKFTIDNIPWKDNWLANEMESAASLISHEDPSNNFTFTIRPIIKPQLMKKWKTLH